MFTGIVTDVGRISEVTDFDGDKTIVINMESIPTDDLDVGDSICVNGVCLTVTRIETDLIYLDVSAETLACTNFNQYKAGTRVNIEKAMLLDTRLNGHLVSGHVDCVAKIGSITEDGRSVRYEIILPEDYLQYVCKKGSICIDGVSLTINDTAGTNISVNIIPQTIVKTIFSDYVEGSLVNVEVDIVARYLEALIKPYR